MDTALKSLTLDTVSSAAKRRLAPALLATALLLAACSGGGGSGSPTAGPTAANPTTGPTIGPTSAASPLPETGNILPNPGFEDGSDPWISLSQDSGFQRTEEQAHSGKASALLRMRDGPEADGSKVYYLVQEVSPAEMPEVVRGYYKVENWNKGTLKQYLQFVVIAWAPDNFPTDAPNWQIRYPLAGIDSPPFLIGNAHFVFIGKEEPVQGEWVYFETNVRDDFKRLWGQVPEGFEFIRILFEVRFDGKVAGGDAAEADVYYDDLYFGPADGG
jgi:hypothetical protein